MAEGQEKWFVTAERCELIPLLPSRQSSVSCPASPGAGWPVAPPAITG